MIWVLLFFVIFGAGIISVGKRLIQFIRYMIKVINSPSFVPESPKPHRKRIPNNAVLTSDGWNTEMLKALELATFNKEISSSATDEIQNFLRKKRRNLDTQISAQDQQNLVASHTTLPVSTLENMNSALPLPGKNKPTQATNPIDRPLKTGTAASVESVESKNESPKKPEAPLSVIKPPNVPAEPRPFQRLLDSKTKVNFDAPTSLVVAQHPLKATHPVNPVGRPKAEARTAPISSSNGGKPVLKPNKELSSSMNGSDNSKAPKASVPSKPSRSNPQSLSPESVSGVKNLFKKLITPENIRILQGLGITIIFISGAAVIRDAMWVGASPWIQWLLLAAATISCSSLGYALYRWTGLKITGLGFLVLGHLSLLLNTYAALIETNAGGPALYAYAQSSLWMIMFSVFTISSWWHARKLKEPLFDAFTLWGGLAAWGSALTFMETPWTLLPAGFLPVIFLARSLAKQLSHAPNPDAAMGTRWRLAWWLQGTWSVGANVAVVVLPLAAFYSVESKLVSELPWHLCGLLLLTAIHFVDAFRSQSKWNLQAGMVLLGIPLALLARAYSWNPSQCTLVVFAPGVLLTSLALLLPKLLTSKTQTKPKRFTENVSYIALIWGQFCLAITSVWIVKLHLLNQMDLPLLIPILALSWLACMASALKAKEVGSVWLAGFQLGQFATLVCISRGQEWFAWPMAWLAAAAMSYAFWALADKNNPQRKDIAYHGRWVADLTGILAAAILLIHTCSVHFLGASTGSVFIFYGWICLTAYALLTSFHTVHPQRRSLGVLLMIPTIAIGVLKSGQPLAMAAPWFGIISLGVQIFSSGARRLDHSRSCYRATWFSSAALIAVGMVLSGYQFLIHAPLTATWSLLLLVPPVAMFAQWLRNQGDPKNAEWIECLVLFLLAAISLDLAKWWGVPSHSWAILAPGIGAILLFISLFGKWVKHWPVGRNGSEPIHPLPQAPYRLAGDVAGLTLSMIGFVYSWLWSGSCSLDLWFSGLWASALLPAFVYFRPRLLASSKKSISNPSTLDFINQTQTGRTHVAGLFTGTVILSALTMALINGFWDEQITPVLRQSYLNFFILLTVLPWVMGNCYRWKPAPFWAVAGMLGTVGCAYGHWGLVEASFGLGCVLLGIAHLALAFWLKHRPDISLKPLAESSQKVASALIGLGLVHQTIITVQGMAAAHHIYPALSWLIIFGGTIWWVLGRRNEIGNQQAKAVGVGSGLALLGAAFHISLGLHFSLTEMGPTLMLVSIILLTLQEVIQVSFTRHHSDEPEGLDPQAAEEAHKARIKLRANFGTGIFHLVLPIGLFASLLGFIKFIAGDPGMAALTFGLGCGLWMGLSILIRKRFESSQTKRAFVLELAGWFSLVLMLSAALDASWIYSLILIGPAWSFLAALILLFGMMGETVAGAWLGADRMRRTPSPFLESRLLVAVCLALYGIFDVLIFRNIGYDPDLLWKALMTASVVTFYAGMARWSWMPQINLTSQRLASFLAHVVLIPAGYLAFLYAHSTGSNVGGLWFALLSPAMLGAAYISRKKGHHEQAAFSVASAVLVNAGAVLLAFIKNPDLLAGVPAGVFAMAAIQCLAVRKVTGNRMATVDGMIAGGLGSLYAIRAFAGVPAWTLNEPWAWEWPWMTALGFGILIMGGWFKLEKTEGKPSLVARGGFIWSSIAAGMAVLSLVWYGPHAIHMTDVGQIARYDAMLSGLYIFAFACVGARIWAGVKAGEWLAPILVMIAYVLTVYRINPVAWEWYTLPLALFLYVWSWHLAKTSGPSKDSERQRWAEGMLLVASLFAILPSFFQALQIHSDSHRELYHYLMLLGVGLIMVLAAMATRRKVPLLVGSAGMILGTLVKVGLWATLRGMGLPMLGIGVGFGVLALATLFESRMNQTVRVMVGRAQTEAKVFWETWR